MCGITGILGNDLSPEDKQETIQKMISALQHRGPDGWGVYYSSDMSLGNTRLSIIDLSTGDQPMMSKRFVISYNGEIYNYVELRKELLKKGYKFKTSSDTEVILKAFEAYGLDTFAKLNGQFALLLWDKKKKRLIVGRDRYGIRPLYILEHGGRRYFSSEIKAFDVIDGYHRCFEFQNLYQHALLWNTLGDKTVFKGIRCISAGTYEIHQCAKFVFKTRYYEIGESNQKSPAIFEDAVEDFTDLLADSVRLRLRSDVPVATYLSGGIDSSVTTYLTSQTMGGLLQTFSISFEDKEYDESSYQQEMVDSIGSNHFSLNIKYRDINDAFLDAAYHFERPVFRTAGVPLFLLSKEVNRAGVKVVLTGEGADEILCGYDSFRELKILDFWHRSPSSKIRPLLIKKLYPHLRHFNNPMQFGFMRMYYEGFLGNYSNELTGLNIRVHNNQIVSKYFSGDNKYQLDKDDLLESIRCILPDNYNCWTLLQKNQFLEMKTILSGYLLSSQGDRMSMAHSVEGRYPFLDHRVVEKAFYLQDSFKLNGFSQKHILKQAYGNELPSTIISRPKKPYTAPDLKSFYYKGKLSEPASYFLSPTVLKNTGVFDDKAVSLFLRKFDNKIPEEIGYRDNMLISFILSCQIIDHWINNPKAIPLDEKLKTVEIFEIN